MSLKNSFFKALGTLFLSYGSITAAYSMEKADAFYPGVIELKLKGHTKPVYIIPTKHNLDYGLVKDVLDPIIQNAKIGVGEGNIPYAKGIFLEIEKDMTEGVRKTLGIAIENLDEILNISSRLNQEEENFQEIFSKIVKIKFDYYQEALHQTEFKVSKEQIAQLLRDPLHLYTQKIKETLDSLKVLLPLGDHFKNMEKGMDNQIIEALRKNKSKIYALDKKDNSQFSQDSTLSKMDSEKIITMAEKMAKYCYSLLITLDNKISPIIDDFLKDYAHRWEDKNIEALLKNALTAPEKELKKLRYSPEIDHFNPLNSKDYGFEHTILRNKKWINELLSIFENHPKKQIVVFFGSAHREDVLRKLLKNADTGPQIQSMKEMSEKGDWEEYEPKDAPLPPLKGSIIFLENTLKTLEEKIKEPLKLDEILLNLNIFFKEAKVRAQRSHSIDPSKNKLIELYQKAHEEYLEVYRKYNTLFYNSSKKKEKLSQDVLETLRMKAIELTQSSLENFKKPTQ